jgi:putative ABC transport system substrate-binding protein
MRRRDFLTLVGGAAAAWPLALHAQQTPRLVGYLTFRSDEAVFQAFRQGLRDAGFVEGQNLVIEYRTADNQTERVSALAADLVRRKVAVFAVTGNMATILAAKAATATIPIVFLSPPDPVRAGLVPSLNRPGGNLTGATLLSSDLTAKRLGLLHDAVPQMTDVAMFLGRPPFQEDPEGQFIMAQAAARNIGLQIFGVDAGEPSEFETAFASAAARGAGALLVSTSAYFLANRERIVALAAKYKLPAMYQSREYADAGGLMSYGSSIPEAIRQIGRYAGRILKGEKAGDLPVLQPTKFELVINLKTAKALGIEVPSGISAVADEVIE